MLDGTLVPCRPMPPWLKPSQKAPKGLAGPGGTRAGWLRPRRRASSRIERGTSQVGFSSRNTTVNEPRGVAHCGARQLPGLQSPSRSGERPCAAAGSPPAGRQRRPRGRCGGCRCEAGCRPGARGVGQAVVGRQGTGARRRAWRSRLDRVSPRTTSWNRTSPVRRDWPASCARPRRHTRQARQDYRGHDHPVVFCRHAVVKGKRCATGRSA